MLQTMVAYQISNIAAVSTGELIKEPSSIWTRYRSCFQKRGN